MITFFKLNSSTNLALFHLFLFLHTYNMLLKDNLNFLFRVYLCGWTFSVQVLLVHVVACLKYEIRFNNHYFDT